MVSKEAGVLLNKFIQQLEPIFKNLPKPLKWQSFLMNDLILLTDIPSIVQEVSVKHGLNKAQTKALAKLEQVSDKVFHEITLTGFFPFKDQKNTLLPKLLLNEVSARGIQMFAEDLEKTNKKNEQKQDNGQHEFATHIKAALMTRLGILVLEYAKLLENCGWKIKYPSQTRISIWSKINFILS